VRTAKELFQASTGFNDYKVFRASVGYETACQAALLQFVESLAESNTDPTHAMHGLQIMGARRVLDILSRLHEPDPKPTPEPSAWQYKKGP